MVDLIAISSVKTLLGIVGSAVDTGSAETITGTKTFNSSAFEINNLAGTFQYIFAGSAITADRIITIPVLTAGSTLAFTNFAQTFTVLQTFRSTFMQIQNPANTFNYVFVTSAIIASRNVTFPLLTANANFVFDSFLNVFTVAQTLQDVNLILGTTTGTQIGTLTTQKLAFYGKTPVVQQAAIPDTASGVVATVEAEVNKVKALLRVYGFIA